MRTSDRHVDGGKIILEESYATLVVQAAMVLPPTGNALSKGPRENIHFHSSPAYEPPNGFLSVVATTAVRPPRTTVIDIVALCNITNLYTTLSTSSIATAARMGRTRRPAVPEGITIPRRAAPQTGRPRRTARPGPGWLVGGRKKREGEDTSESKKQLSSEKRAGGDIGIKKQKLSTGSYFQVREGWVCLARLFFAQYPVWLDIHFCLCGHYGDRRCYRGEASERALMGSFGSVDQSLRLSSFVWWHPQWSSYGPKLVSFHQSPKRQRYLAELREYRAAKPWRHRGNTTAKRLACFPTSLAGSFRWPFLSYWTTWDT